MTTNFVPGRYVRSATEAERMIADGDRSAGGQPGRIIQAVRRGDTAAERAAQLIIELCRRGYVLPWHAAVASSMSMTRTVVDSADMVIAARTALAEPGRDEKAQAWSAIAADEEAGDEWYDQWLDKPDERKARSRLYWGMQNRAMRDKLERGECVDLSQCRKAGPYYVISGDVYQDDVDYCDADIEDWIHSIGRHHHTHELHASVGADLYQNDAYACVYLR